MRLERLLSAIEVQTFHGSPGAEIKGIAYDSRAVKPGFLFVALRGQRLDGHDYVKEAIQNGAVSLVQEYDRGGKGIDAEVTTIKVKDSRAALSMLATTFYDRPFEGMNLIGITGTNGKTTTSYLLESILLAAGGRPGVIGTINYRVSGHTWEAPVTTPESLDLMRMLRQMADADVTDVVVEVSSHALDLGRVRDCPFRVAILTNISRDHLDYHVSMEEYVEAKGRLFKDLGKMGGHELTTAVINADDPRGKEFAALTDARVVTYGLKTDCDVSAEGLQLRRTGLSAQLITPAGKIGIRSPLIGDFNIYNILAASAAALCMDISLGDIASGIERLKGVPGRLELVKNKRSLAIVVDYAHTPDALLKALGAVRSLVKGRLITIFGCGGDRDKGKRREMGHVATQLSDLIFITSDNPRTEDPAVIISQIEEGVREAGAKKVVDLFRDQVGRPGYVVELDRGNAIRRAVEIAHEGDLILIAGKGHEDYQIIGKDRRDFDDRKVAADAASVGN
jgi:UDP-N-acetylmuramoyl-L-alanyl-D-glutamate--2,6-diaminopimelate ligase